MGLAYVQVWPKYLDICFAVTYGFTLILAYTIPESFVRRWLQVITQGGISALITVRKCVLLLSAGVSAHVLSLSLKVACHVPKCSGQAAPRQVANNPHLHTLEGAQGFGQPPAVALQCAAGGPSGSMQ